MIMTRTTRRFLFYGLFIVFIPLSIAVILYSIGWQLNLENCSNVELLNCLGIRQSPFLFFKFFRRIISLPLNEIIRHKLSTSNNYIWYPGFSSLKPGHHKQSDLPEGKLSLLFNSSLLRHNSPESILTLAQENSWIKITVTDTEDNFRTYFKNNGIKIKSEIPENLKFIGILQFDEYVALIKQVDGILLCRDESLFENQYNFPSKFIEALQLNIPFFSLFKISPVSQSLYFTIEPNGTFQDAKHYIKQFH